jgi:hypothetical protein
VVNGFDEIMSGQTVYVTADGMYLAEVAPPRPASPLARAAQWLDDLLSVRAAHAAFLSRSYVTDGRGEILVELDKDTLPYNGVVTVTARIGENEQTFTLNGQRNDLRVTFSGGDGDFTTPGPQGYQKVVRMTVKRYVNDVEQPVTGNVSWEVDSEITGLSTGTDGVWRRDKNALNGLMWVDDATYVVPSDGSWHLDEIEGQAPDNKTTVYLADIVGSRKITVTVTADGITSPETTFTFGAGPLSVFRFVQTTPLLPWANSNEPNAYRACNDTPFDHLTPGSDPLYPDNWTEGQYVGGPNMPTREHYKTVARLTSKGAALAAGWANVGPSYYFWSGDAYKERGVFGVRMDNGGNQGSFHLATENQAFACLKQ